MLWIAFHHIAEAYVASTIFQVFEELKYQEMWQNFWAYIIFNRRMS